MLTQDTFIADHWYFLPSLIPYKSPHFPPKVNISKIPKRSTEVSHVALKQIFSPILPQLINPVSPFHPSSIPQNKGTLPLFPTTKTRSKLTISQNSIQPQFPGQPPIASISLSPLPSTKQYPNYAPWLGARCHPSAPPRGARIRLSRKGTGGASAVFRIVGANLPRDTRQKDGNVRLLF